MGKAFCLRGREKKDDFGLQLSQVSQDECLCGKGQWYGPERISR